jgi:hypothetical protein
VALAFIQWYLARPLGQHALLPWEATGRPVTPRHVRRVIPAMVSQGGTPARPYHPRGKAPGRANGFHPKPALRHPIVEKNKETAEKEHNGDSDLRCLASAGHVNGSFFVLNHAWSGSARVPCV